MSKKIIVVFGLIVLVIGICFATDYITLSQYEAQSSVSVNTQNASILISRVNALLTRVGASNVTLTGAARDWGDANLHPESRAIDLRFNQTLYDNIVNNIAGSGLRVECIECIRKLGQADHIHLDIGRSSSDSVGRFFHATTH